MELSVASPATESDPGHSSTPKIMDPPNSSQNNAVHPLEEDFRVSWMKQIAFSLLSKYDQPLLRDCLARANGRIEQEISAFLSRDFHPLSPEDRASGCTAFFLKLRVEEESVLEEEDEGEEEEGDRSTIFTESSVEPEPQKEEKGKGKKAKKGGKGKGGKKGESRSKRSPSFEVKKRDSLVSDAKTKVKGKKKKKGPLDEEISAIQLLDGGEGKAEEEEEEEDYEASDAGTDVDVESLPEDIKQYYMDFVVSKIPLGLGVYDGKSVYFLRKGKAPVPIVRSMEEADEVLPKHLIFGNMTGYELRRLQDFLMKLYTPCIFKDLMPTRKRFSGRFGVEMQEFMKAHIREYDQELPMNLLNIPDLLEFDELRPDITYHSKNEYFVQNLETLCSEWTEKLKEVLLTREFKQTPESNAPLAEIQDWTDRYITLSSIREQLLVREVRFSCEVLKKAGKARVCDEFKANHKELLQQYEQAKDISRSFSAVIKPLRVLTYSENFSEIRDAIPQIAEGLYLLSALSRHYNKVDRHFGFAKSVSNLLFERTLEAVIPINLLKLDQKSVLERLKDIKTILRSWKETFLQARKKVGASKGRIVRWEFETELLFRKTDEIYNLAEDLSEMLQYLMEHRNLLWSNFCFNFDSFTNEGFMIRQEVLLLPLVEMNFDPYAENFELKWSNLVVEFRKEVQLLDRDVIIAVDEVLSKMVVNQALESLDSIKGIRVRENLGLILTAKFEEILQRFIDELNETKQYFSNKKEDPPVSNETPISGRVQWTRDLSEKILKTLKAFQNEADFVKPESLENGSRICNQLLDEMKEYENWWFGYWKELFPHVVATSFRDNLLSRKPAEGELGHTKKHNEGKSVVQINSPEKQLEMIREAKNFDQLGFKLTPKMRNIMLLEDTLTENSEAMKAILDKYYAVRRQLRTHECEFLDRFIRDLEIKFESGLTHLTWTSLGIQDYQKLLLSIVQRFQGTVTQVNAVSKEIRVRVLKMMNYRLFKEPPYLTGKQSLPVLHCSDYFKYWEINRSGVWKKLVQLHRKIPPFCRQLESLSYGTLTGRSKRFRSYYWYWESCVFKHLAKIVIRSLHSFEVRMNKNVPLFDVDAVLETPEIKTVPSFPEIFRLLSEAMMDCIDGTKKLHRWGRGTCIPVHPMRTFGTDQFVYSYYLDVGRLPRVLQLMLQIQDNYLRIMRNLWVYLKKYREFKNLWMYSKEETVVLFAEKNPSVKDYNSKMEFYGVIIERLEGLPSYRVEGCVRLNMRPLHDAIINYARDWILLLGENLHESTVNCCKEFQEKIEKWEAEVYFYPSSKEELKVLLKTLNAIQMVMIEMETQYRDLIERHEVMRAFSIEVDCNEIPLIEENWRRWRRLTLLQVPVIARKMLPLQIKYGLSF